MTRARAANTVLAAGIAALAMVLAWRIALDKGVSRSLSYDSGRATASSPSSVVLIPPSDGAAGAAALKVTAKTEKPPATAEGARLQLAPIAVHSARERNRRRALSLFVAKVAANEGALHNHADAALIWQTTRVNGDKARDGRLGWLRRHSKRVAGIEPCLRGNCFWTPRLTRSSRMPRGFVPDAKWWRDDTAAAWTALLGFVDSLVLNDRRDADPCAAVEPRTWGSLELDLEGAMNRGLYPIGCGREVLNDGFAEAATCMPNATWLCAPIPIFPRARVQSKAAVIAAAEARPL